MSCGPVETTFRVLAETTFWSEDVLAREHVEVGDVIALSLVTPESADEAALVSRMPDPRLARGCEACEWYLAADCPPAGRLLHREGVAAWVNSCTGEPEGCAPGWAVLPKSGCRLALDHPVAVAARRGRVAVVDAGAGVVHVLTARGERIVASAPTSGAGPIAFTPGGDLLVAGPGAAVVRHDRAGTPVATLPAPPSPPERLAVASDGAVWIATAIAGQPGLHALFVLEPGRAAWRAGGSDELAAALPDTGVLAADASGFCLRIPRGGAEPGTACFDWCGDPLAPGVVKPQPARARQRRGFVAFQPIDSGIPRCRWHRVRLAAEIPERTRIAAWIATAESEAEAPHDEDWQKVTDATDDFLVDQPPGRWAHVRLELFGDGAATPSIRQVRLDFPRSTSAERLPAVFRKTPEAEDFLERFVSLFDATIEDMDEAISRFPALLDTASAPEEALAWLAELVDAGFDPAWSPVQRRRWLEELPALYRRRGTPGGLARAIEIATGVTPAIEELGLADAYAPFGQARVGETRLFGRARARVRLGSSPLGGAPLRSHGDPATDALTEGTYRIRVQLPPAAGAGTPIALARVERLVEAQKPAHVLATVRVGQPRLLLGAAAVGIDTNLGGLPRPILGREGNVRLRRMSVLAAGASRHGGGLSVGQAAITGVQTVLW